MLFMFGNFTLDSDRRELRAADANIAVEPQVFDLLEFLIRNRDRVVSRDDLIEHVWQDRIVSESALATRINAARRAIDDDGARQALIKTIARKGVRFVGDVQERASRPAAMRAADKSQVVKFCRTSDGVNLAIGLSGSGPVLLKTANWLNHLEFDWQSPIWSPLYARLSDRFRLIRYDGRGGGLSDRDVKDISFAGFLRDLEAVIDSLAIDRLALLGISQGAAAAIAYAVRHPERVSRLILYGGYAQGRNRRSDDGAREQGEAMLALMQQGWGNENSAFMRAFSSIYLPNGTPEQIKWFAEMQKMATSAELAVRMRLACDDIDVLDLLPRVSVPTLVLHSRQDTVAPYAQGRAIAAAIPNATFITLETEDHILLPGEPAWEKMVTEIERLASEG
jgi:DNA-binding winged helix-turn-helix (wHTH) protein/alpha-beta hydrolase superfamily lysophospholipase